jgi:hypothetical protein
LTRLVGYRDFIAMYAKAPDWMLAGLQKGHLYAMTGKYTARQPSP